MAADPLASWWVHEITVERRTGTTGSGAPRYDDAVTVPCFIAQQTETVRGPDGPDVIERTDIAYPITVPLIGQGSRVTLPAAFGGQPTTVLAAARGDGGGLPTPDHQTMRVG